MSDAPRTSVLPADRPKGKPQTGMKTLADMILSRQEAFAAVATRYLPAERLVKLAQLAISRNPDLLECTGISILECLMMCSRLGLEPGEPGGIWLIKFKGVCTPIIDYRGMIDVARRSGEVIAVHADIRCANDTFHWQIDTTGTTMLSIKHQHADGDRGAVLGAYFLARLKSGEYQGAYLSKSEVDEYRKRSKADAKGFSPWQTDYNAMAMKTAVRRGVNLLPKTPELQQLISELQREEDQVDNIMDGLPETSTAAIERMIAEMAKTDQATADAIMAAFDKLDYSPARRVQLLTQYNGHPKRLLDFVTAEIGGAAAVQSAITEGQPGERITPEDIAAARKEPDAVPVKNKGGRPKGSGAKKAEASTATKAVKTKGMTTNPDVPDGTIIDVAPGTVQAGPENVAPAVVPAGGYTGGSF